MTTVMKQIKFEAKGRRKRAVVGAVPEPAAATTGRVPRVARLMALAIRYDQMLRDGTVANQSELASLAHVTQPRMTQIMNLLHLAPDIQEQLLLLQEVTDGRDHICERSLRGIVTAADWSVQRRRWAALASGVLAPSR